METGTGAENITGNPSPYSHLDVLDIPEPQHNPKGMMGVQDANIRQMKHEDLQNPAIMRGVNTLLQINDPALKERIQDKLAQAIHEKGWEVHMVQLAADTIAALFTTSNGWIATQADVSSLPVSAVKHFNDLIIGPEYRGMGLGLLCKAYAATMAQGLGIKSIAHLDYARDRSGAKAAVINEIVTIPDSADSVYQGLNLNIHYGPRPEKLATITPVILDAYPALDLEKELYMGRVSIINANAIGDEKDPVRKITNRAGSRYNAAIDSPYRIENPEKIFDEALKEIDPSAQEDMFRVALIGNQERLGSCLFSIKPDLDFLRNNTAVAETQNHPLPYKIQIEGIKLYVPPENAKSLLVGMLQAISQYCQGKTGTKCRSLQLMYGENNLLLPAVIDEIQTDTRQKLQDMNMISYVANAQMVARMEMIDRIYNGLYSPEKPKQQSFVSRFGLRPGAPKGRELS